MIIMVESNFLSIVIDRFSINQFLLFFCFCNFLKHARIEIENNKKDFNLDKMLFESFNQFILFILKKNKQNFLFTNKKKK